MKRFLTLLTIFYSLSAFSQSDKFANKSLEFVKLIVESADIDKVIVTLNDSLNGDELIEEIKSIREKLKADSEHIQYYMIKVDAPIPLYNINLHNPKKKEQYGDFRIMFSNENDVLIDKFKFFENQELEIDDDMEMPDFPPPPPPAPRK